MRKISPIIFLFALKSLSFAHSYPENLSRTKRGLMYPTGSAFQLTMGLASPIEIIRFHNRIPQVNLLLAVNYDMPSTWAQFFSPQYWQQTRSLEESRAFFPRRIPYVKPDFPAMNSTRMKRDLSAGDFYGSLKEMLLLFGYDESCLLKMICELGESPIHVEEDDLLAEVLHLILTPSLHQAFDKHEEKSRKASEEAEMHGKSGRNCHKIYTECPESPLNTFTSLQTLLE